MSQLDTIDVALFPIPGAVAFPGTQMPLHVFEPRYRAMIKFCLDNDVMLAVSHTRKELKSTLTHPLNKNDSRRDLNKNLQSHESHDVFSAGPCELIEVTADGRMHVEVDFKYRLQKIKHLQQVPFQTVRCEYINDQASSLEPQKIADMLSELQQVVSAISQQASPALYAILQQDEWQNLSPEAFSFRVFDYFKFEADFMQEVLQQNQVEKRLKMIFMGFSRAV